MPSSLAKFWYDINEYSALISWTTLFFMFATKNYTISLRKGNLKQLILATIYLDCIAWCFAWNAMMWSDWLNECQQFFLWLCADFVWSVKDATKYSYMAWRTTKAVYPKTKHPLRTVGAVAGTSLLLYWTLMYQAHDVGVACYNDDYRYTSVYMWSLPVLYFFWASVDLVSGVLLVKKLLTYSNDTALSAANKSSGHADNIYTTLARKEEIRVAISSTAMVIVSSIAAYRYIFKSDRVNTMSSFVFISSQALLAANAFDNDPKSKGAIDNSESPARYHRRTGDAHDNTQTVHQPATDMTTTPRRTHHWTPLNNDC